VVLSHALREQPRVRQRLISLLVSRAQLDPDDGALALSAQLGVPAALQRHLERRDPRVLELVPPDLATRWVVLPLARARTGQLIVIARDPTPILAAALAHAAKTAVILAVTPAIQLERILRAIYGIAGDPDEPLPATPPQVSEIGSISLDDPLEEPVPRRSRTVSGMFQVDRALELPTRGAPSPTKSPIDTSLDDIDRAPTRSAAERVAIAAAGARWGSALLLGIADGVATGKRGHNLHGGEPEAIAVSLAAPSIVATAVAERKASAELVDSPLDDRLAHALAAPTGVVAAPVMVGGQAVEAVVVVPARPVERRAAQLAELDRLVDALAATYARIGRDAR